MGVSRGVDTPRPKLGLFIGRFQPFHTGHFEVVTRAFCYVEHLKIAIGSSQYSKMKGNPWTFKERASMILNAMQGQYIHKIEIFSLPDIGDPHEWPLHVRRIVGDFDLLFSGNTEGVVNVFRDSALHWKPDVVTFLQTQRISGTQVRNELYNRCDTWKALVPKGTIEVIEKSKNHSKFVSKTIHSER